MNKTTVQIFKEQLETLRRLRKEYGFTNDWSLKLMFDYINAKYPPKK